MKLTDVTIHKYKSFETDQHFKVNDNITILVGMNESGKTAILESIAKTNYFQDDKDFKFNKTHDFPRREKKKIEKSGEKPNAITCKYELEKEDIDKIEQELGKDIIKTETFSISTDYNNKNTWNTIEINRKKIIKNLTTKLGISSNTLNEKLERINSKDELELLKSEYSDDKYTEGLSSLEKYFENEWKWERDAIGEYISRVFLKKSKPKFLYYDEYYLLPSRISIEKVVNGNLDEDLEPEKVKTAKALFELAELNPEEILEANNFEDFIAELEATEAIISDELFKYWTTNQNLNIEFKIDKIEKTEKRQTPNGQVTDVKIVEHFLDIRVKNQRVRVSLPLRNRSKGFNWFFSFLVWFKKIQEDKNTKYILLLDEPGLSLHASAQADMLRFLEDLSIDYQIIYTTHSPFAIPSENLDRVRTVLETEKGSVISDSVQEKDPKTLFPLQAALGYDIAQNLFISTKNLLVEGISDLIYLEILSGILEGEGKVGLRKDITLVPTGGLDKVATFISLLRGNKLEVVCLLDTPTDPKGRARLEDMIKHKLISEKKIRYFNDFIQNYNQADIEDLFTKQDYIKLFNKTFEGEYTKLEVSDLNDKIQPIIIQINKALNIERFNHYRPANELLKQGLSAKDFEEETLNNFEKVIGEINRLFK
jgi:predicted ATPase